MCVIFSYKYRPLSLHELLQELEDPDTIAAPPDGIVLFPPDNANDENTDEDSGEEDFLTLNNLPGSHLRAEAEVFYDNGTPTDNGECSKEDIQWESEDDLPISTFLSKKRSSKCFQSSKTKKLPIKWLNNDLNVTFPLWSPVEGPFNEVSPVNLFRHFFDDEVLSTVLDFTNTYALQNNRDKTVTKEEILCFIGILLVSGYNTVSRRRMYWQNASDTKNTLISEAMSRDRFDYIMSNLHCNDNTKLDKTDKFSKMRPLFDILNTKFQEFAPMEEAHSVDEAMVPYYGRHNCKQFIRGKPIRWGYKLWVGTTRLGYIVWFEPYQGSSSIISEKYKDMGLGAAVVLLYADILGNSQPFHIYFDNFFTSLPLLQELKNRNIKGTGTIRENRISNCEAETCKILKKTKRGSFRYQTANDSIVMCKWNDNSVVSICSNALPVFPINKVKRYSRVEKKHIYIDQPYLIQKYNENMGGVDRSDQNIGLTRISVRGKKWYFPLFAHCVDMAMQNAWQLHRNNEGKLDQLAFRRAIATGLIESNKRRTKTGPSKPSRNLHEHSKYDRMDHLIEYQEKQTRCGVCHKNSYFKCRKCLVALHPKQCFLKYHTC